jgi:hypothetical protein
MGGTRRQDHATPRNIPEEGRSEDEKRVFGAYSRWKDVRGVPGMERECARMSRNEGRDGYSSSITVKTEAASFSETFVPLCQFTRHHIPDIWDLHQPPFENLKSPKNLDQARSQTMNTVGAAASTVDAYAYILLYAYIMLYYIHIYIVEPGYNNDGLCDTPSTTLHFLCYQLIPHC